jgi:hypothetical protein
MSKAKKTKVKKPKIDMYETLVTISWCAQDVKSYRPNWSDERCLEFIENHTKGLEEACISSGNDFIDIISNEENDEGKDYGDDSECH